MTFSNKARRKRQTRGFLPPTPPETYTLARRWLGTKSYWLCQLCGWGILCACQMLSFMMVRDQNITILEELQSLLFLSASGIFFTHLLRIIYIFGRHRQYAGKKMLGFGLIAPGVVSIGMGGLVWAVIILIIPDALEKSEIESSNGIPEFISFCVMCYLLMLSWTICYFSLLIQREYQTSSMKLLQMDAALKEARLRALKAQINPHFLFNSLNTVRALIPHDLTVPRDAITMLADFLRASLTSEHKETVPFREEMEIVHNYLAMEKLRHEDRLRMVCDISPGVMDWEMPIFMFQTVVENAVKYGIGTQEQGGLLSIRASVQNDILTIRVANPGRIDVNRASTGLGLRNAKARLELLYGDRADIRLEQSEPNLVSCTLRLPRLEKGESHTLEIPSPR